MTLLRSAAVVACVAVSWCGTAFAHQVADVESSQEPIVDPTFPELELDLAPPTTDFIDPQPLERPLRGSLEIPDGFCKAEDYELTRDERRLCGLADSAKARCPGFARACDEASGPAGASSKSRRARDRDDRRDPSVDVSRGPLGEVLGGVMKLIFWGLLALGIGAMIVSASTALLGRRKRSDDGSAAAPEARVLEVARTLPSGSPAELLARARASALSGDLETAMELVLRALLRHLEIRGRLELHPSRTNGDYARSLRQKGHDAGDLRRVAAEVEAIEFGGARPSAETFSALHARVSKLVEVAGVVVVCLLFGVTTGCQQRKASESSLNSCGTDADGYSALCETIKARGVEVRRRFGSLTKIGDDVARVVVLAEDLEAPERKVLLDWVESGGMLVLFERASAYDERFVSSIPCGNDLTLEPSAWNLRFQAKPRFSLPGASTLHEAAGGRVTVRCGDAPFVLEVSHGAGSIVAVGDARLPMNASLAIADNAALVVSLVAPSGRVVELVGAWTGSATERPAESLTRSGLLPWFLQILALGLVFALYRGSPFGSRREPVSVSRRAFAEHAVALGDAYSRARASRLSLVHFGAFAFERLRVRLSATKHGRMSDLAGTLAARHAVSEAEVMSLVAAVRSAEDPEHDSASEAEHLAALRKLAALVKRTGGPA